MENEMFGIFKGLLADDSPRIQALLRSLLNERPKKHSLRDRAGERATARETMLAGITCEREGRKERAYEIYGTRDKWRSIHDSPELRKVGYK